MPFILGMDTGGTYTDGVIVDAATKAIVCKAKALTTKEDLTLGIKDCIERLDFQDTEAISLASLSTTLATNAIVEGRGARVGLIYMGMELDEEVPAETVVKAKGRFDIMGRLKEDVDREEIRRILESMKGKVQALAVSGYASVRNPKHEQEVRRLADEILDVPVVCAHQLTSALGFHHRTVTAVLNGRLIPIISELLKATRTVLKEKSIHAPMMIVKGDGTLMTEAMAKERPIETILSGPAASIIGGLALTGEKDGLILDMGGTTTDLANASDGAVNVRKEGAKIGGWFTRVRAVEISTFGLGGDSRIWLNKKGNLEIGPQKVWPLCIAGHRYPYLIHELKSFRRVGEYKAYFEQEADCYFYVGGQVPKEALPEEREIVAMLQDGPHSLTYLAKAVGKAPETIDLTCLVESGILARISVTPTDILHVRGKYLEWDRNLAQAGVEILSKRKEISVSRFLDIAERMIHEKMAMCCVQSGVDFDEKAFSIEESPQAMYLMELAFRGSGASLLRPRMRLNKPVVAIGAPARAWTGEVGNLLGTKVMVPENADVANAYGAAIGQVTEMVELLISKDGDKFILNAPWERNVYSTKDEAMFYAIHEGRKYIQHQLMDAGYHSWKIEEKPSDIMVQTAESQEKTYMGTKLVITGIGSALPGSEIQ